MSKTFLSNWSYDHAPSLARVIVKKKLKMLTTNHLERSLRIYNHSDVKQVFFFLQHNQC